MFFVLAHQKSLVIKIDSVIIVMRISLKLILNIFSHLMSKLCYFLQISFMNLSRQVKLYYSINLPIFIFQCIICIRWIIFLISYSFKILHLLYLIEIIIVFVIYIFKIILPDWFILLFSKFFQWLRIYSLNFLYPKILFHIFIRYFYRIIKIYFFWWWTFI